MSEGNAPRIACVDVPALPLQLLLRSRPRWRERAVAVVTETGPDARLVQLNTRARRMRLRPGMRQADARRLVPDLHVGRVPESWTRDAVRELTHALQTWSPRVEPDGQFQGVFFLDPRGLSRLYGGMKSWATSIRSFLQGRGLSACVVVGFERFRALAVARAPHPRAKVHVLDDPHHERTSSDAVPLTHLPFPAELREGLRALGIHTLREFTALPGDELRTRFGPDAAALHERFAPTLQLVMQPSPLHDPVRVTLSIDPPDANHERLTFAIKGALHELTGTLEARSQALVALQLELGLEPEPSSSSDATEPPTVNLRIEPAAPTRDVRSVLELIRLRLETLELEAPVERVALQAESVTARNHQLPLQAETAAPSARTADAERALARVRATWGAEAVTRAHIRDAHLPEARFRWEPITRVEPPRVDARNTSEHVDTDTPRADPSRDRASAPAASRTEETAAPDPAPAALVRRVLPRPDPLPPRRPDDPRAGPRLPPENGHLHRMYGPYRTSGGWWGRREVERDYYYVETSTGTLLWIFFDRARGRWFLHGIVD